MREVPISFGGGKGSADLLVANVGYPLVLRHDFSAQAKTIWDFGKGILHLLKAVSGDSQNLQEVRGRTKQRTKQRLKDQRQKQSFVVATTTGGETAQAGITRPGRQQKLTRWHHSENQPFASAGVKE